MPSRSMSGMRACGSKPPLRPSLYSIACRPDHALPGAHAADAAEARSAAEDLLLQEQALLAVIVLHEFRGARSILRVHVVVPKRERLQDMPIGINQL